MVAEGEVLMPRSTDECVQGADSPGRDSTLEPFNRSGGVSDDAAAEKTLAFPRTLGKDYFSLTAKAPGCEEKKD